RPTPPVSARPRGLSVTRIERLIRDPYAIYAQYVLKIYPLDRLNMPPDARGRGTAIHQALEQFEYAAGQDDPDQLLGLLEEALLAAGESRADLIGLRDRRRAVVADYIDWRAQIAPPFMGQPLTEAYGKIELMVKGAPFKLSATADRIERRPDGRLAILDFKSGAPPSERQVRSGLAPQMPLQGLIAQKGGWNGAGLPAAPVSELTYIRFGTQFDVREIGAGGRGQDAVTAAELIDETEARLVALLAQFATPDHPYLSAPRPERVSYWSDYTRLARRDEWAGLGTYD
ncbi:MAG: PD-(D/E)XK nuclease family protein, partial [Pseudomonadota bacterium]